MSRMDLQPPTQQPLSRLEADWMAMALGVTACRSADALTTTPAWALWLSRSEGSILAAAGALSVTSAVLLLGA